MLSDQGDHNHRHGTGRTGNHARAPTKNGSQQAHHEGGIQANQRFNTGNKGESDSLWHQRQCNRQTR